MKYLCLIYIDEKKLDETPAEAVEAVADDCRDHTEELRRDGRFIASERLEPVRAAVTVRTQDGKASATDGPFAETKEQLAGFYLIEAPDMDEAKRIAARIPPGRLGCVEVRPVMAEGGQ